MKIYSISTAPILNLIKLFDKIYNCIGFADDVTSHGKTKDLRKWWELVSSCSCFGYYHQSQKFWIVLKEFYRLTGERKFHDININITTAGRQQLGPVIKDGKYWK